MLLLLVVCCWAAFLLGLDEIPGWQGFGKGLAVGSLAAGMRFRRISIALLLLAGCWAAFLAGLDKVPGWQGMGKGAAVGSLGLLVFVIIRKFWRGAENVPNSA